MGAATVVITKKIYSSDRSVVMGTITPSTSYATGGETFTLASFGLVNGLDDLDVYSTGGFIPSTGTLATAPKLLVHQQSAATGALTQVPNATNLSTSSFPFRAVGS
jgi:hypothetical protein